MAEDKSKEIIETAVGEEKNAQELSADDLNLITGGLSSTGGLSGVTSVCVSD